MDKQPGQKPMQQFRVVNTHSQNRWFEVGRLGGKYPFPFTSQKRYAMEMADGVDLAEDAEEDFEQDQFSYF